MRASVLTMVTAAALFAGALVASLRLGGSSPIIWIDTFNDELEVQRCLRDDSCTLTGMSTSVPGQSHAVAWLELRSLSAWLGFGIEGAHRIILVANAVAVVVLYYATTLLAGPIGGAVAAWMLLDRLDAFARVTALYNTSPMLFLGTAFVLACTAVVLRPGVFSVMLAALLAAVMTNIHLACALTGVSVVWVALLAPRRSVALATLGAAVFFLVTFVMAPPTWLHNLHGVLQERATGGHPVRMEILGNPLLLGAALACAACLLSLAIRTPRSDAYRRHVQGALAVVVPSLAVFLIAPRFGFNPEPKYILHLKAACALAVALPVGLIANRFVPPRVQYIAPLVFALALAAWTGPVLRARAMAADERVPTIADIGKVAHLLTSELGGSADEALRHLRTPYGITLLSGLQPLLASLPAAPAGSGGDRSAILLMLDRGDMPDALPANWRIIRRVGSSYLVLLTTRTRLDWREPTVCVEPEDGSPQRCDKTRWDPMQDLFVAQLPPGGTGWRGKLRLSFDMRAAEAEMLNELFMPRIPFLCAGEIVAVTDGAVSADRRSATLPAATGVERSRTVTLEWRIGEAGCSGLAYDGMVPFFVEGDMTTVSALATRLRRSETPP